MMRQPLRRVLLVSLFVFTCPAFGQFIYVANAGEDTVSKIDINTNQEVARYRTWFGPSGHAGFYQHSIGNHAAWEGPAPSRIAIDAVGNAYVMDRFFGPPYGPLHLPVLLKINPTLPGPTSTSSTPLAMDDSNANSNIDPIEINDKKIEWARNVGVIGVDEGQLGRALCIDPSGLLWAGIYSSQKYIQINPATGAPTGVTVLTPNHSPYGCVVDSRGNLWSVNEDDQLAEIDTQTHQFTLHTHANYGLNYSVSVRNDCYGKSSLVYMPAHRPSTGGPVRTYIVYDPSSGTFKNPITLNSSFPLFESRAIAVDLDGNVISGATTGRLVKSTPAGAVLWDTGTSGFPTADLRGLIVDAHNDVWAVLRAENKVVKYNGTSGAQAAVVDVGLAPYTYGNVPPPTCPCAEIGGKNISCTSFNAGTGTYSWGFSFVNHDPFGTAATDVTLTATTGNVTITSPASPAPLNPAVPINGTGTVAGTFTVTNAHPGDRVCIDMKLHGGEGDSDWCCPSQEVCFTLPECHDCAKLSATFTCVHGHWVLQLTIVNDGPAAAQSVQVFSTTPGVVIAPAATTIALPVGTPVTIPLSVTGAAPGQPIDLNVNIHGPIDPKTGVYSWCCTSTIKVVYPKHDCGGSPTAGSSNQ